MLPVILAGLGIVALVVVAIIYWDDIVNWFKNTFSNMEQHGLSEEDKNVMAFTVNEGIKNGKYNVVQGLFNKKTNKVTDGRRIVANDLDTKTKNNVCSGEALTIFS